MEVAIYCFDHWWRLKSKQPLQGDNKEEDFQVDGC